MRGKTGNELFGWGDWSGFLSRVGDGRGDFERAVVEFEGSGKWVSDSENVVLVWK